MIERGLLEEQTVGAVGGFVTYLWSEFDADFKRVSMWNKSLILCRCFIT
jgi:hypothetical protein